MQEQTAHTPEVIPNGTGFPTAQELRRWALKLIEPLTPGTILSYEEITEALTLDPREFHRARSAFLRASRDALRGEHKRLLVNVPRIGYRVALPSEHEKEGKRRRRMTVRSAARAHESVIHVDMSGLDDKARHLLSIEQTRTGMQVMFLRRTNRSRALDKAPDLRVQMPNGRLLVEMFTKPKQQAIELS